DRAFTQLLCVQRPFLLKDRRVGTTVSRVCRGYSSPFSHYGILALRCPTPVETQIGTSRLLPGPSPSPDSSSCRCARSARDPLTLAWKKTAHLAPRRRAESCWPGTRFAPTARGGRCVSAVAGLCRRRFHGCATRIPDRTTPIGAPWPLAPRAPSGSAPEARHNPSFPSPQTPYSIHATNLPSSEPPARCPGPASDRFPRRFPPPSTMPVGAACGPRYRPPKATPAAWRRPNPPPSPTPEPCSPTAFRD